LGAAFFFADFFGAARFAAGFFFDGVFFFAMAKDPVWVGGL
jgi:hypothetical protein